MGSKEAAQRVVDVAAQAQGSVADVMAVAQAFLEQARGDSAAEAQDALNVLCAGIGVDDGERATLVALVCGTLVEGGLEPAPMAQPLLRRLRTIAPLARRFHDQCVALMPADSEDADEQMGRLLAEAHATKSPEAAAWMLLEEIYRPAIAMFSVDAQIRAQGRDLLADLEPIADRNAGAHWIVSMLKVLHDEPYVALEPGTGRGIAGRMSGIADNFQLNVLLMDVFPRPLLSVRRVSASAAQVARGDGPQQTKEVLTGRWNLYAWTALQPDKTLPNPKDYGLQSAWIWNEGTPADIPAFEGVRVILLGPPSYERTWGSQRLFNALRAELTVAGKLNRAEVDHWLDRLAVAPRPT